MSQLSNSLVHRVHVDSVRYQNKPVEGEIGAISNRLGRNFKDCTIEEIANLAIKGHSLCPGHFKDTRNKKNWLGQSIIMLDFDNKNKVTEQRVDNPITFEQVKQRLYEYDLGCNFAYTTFSHTDDWHRFRVGIQLNSCIASQDTYKEIASALLKLFPEGDSATSNPVSIFFGGRKLIYEDYSYYLDLDTLTRFIVFFSVRNSSSKNMSRDLSRIKSKLGLCKDGSKKNITYINNIETVKNASNLHEIKRRYETIRGTKFEELRKIVKVLDDFMNPEIKLLHPVLLGLATNLRYMEGGQSLYSECIAANPDYAQDEKLKIMAYCKKENYPPLLFKDFSPYQQDWRLGNLLQAASKKEIIRLEKHKGISVQQAREEIARIFEVSRQQDDCDIYAIKGVTGIGKSELFTNLEDVLIAVPSHRLKDELLNRMKVDCKRTPGLDGLPREVREELEYYYSVGAISAANKYLANMSESYQQVKKYREEYQACYSSEKTVLTTQQKGIFVPWTHKTLIVDEDLLTVLMPTGQTKLNDLVRLEASITNENDKKILTNLIDDIREGRVINPKTIDMDAFEDLYAIERKVLDNKGLYESDILHFLGSKYFMVNPQDVATIFYVRRYELPSDKKIIILSATHDETMYRYMFGNRLKFHDVGNVQPMGLIEQYTKYSFSQSSFLKHMDYAFEKVGESPVITFQAFTRYFPNPVKDLYFWNCSGSDKYKGKNISVVGTPHVSPITLALYAKVLGLPVEAHEFLQVRQQNVYHNGFRFWFNTYDNEYLRTIQFYFIESELRQAIGRSRPYTSMAKVKLLSNYPLPEANILRE